MFCSLALAVQVVEGGLDFLREVAPPYIISECTASLIQGATGQNPGPWLMKVHPESQQRCQHRDMPGGQGLRTPRFLLLAGEGICRGNLLMRCAAVHCAQFPSLPRLTACPPELSSSAVEQWNLLLHGILYPCRILGAAWNPVLHGIPTEPCAHLRRRCWAWATASSAPCGRPYPRT